MQITMPGLKEYMPNVIFFLFSGVSGMEPRALFERGRHTTTQLRSVLRILSLFGSIQGAEVPDSRSAGD